MELIPAAALAACQISQAPAARIVSIGMVQDASRSSIACRWIWQCESTAWIDSIASLPFNGNLQYNLEKLVVVRWPFMIPCHHHGRRAFVWRAEVQNLGQLCAIFSASFYPRYASKQQPRHHTSDGFSFAHEQLFIIVCDADNEIKIFRFAYDLLLYRQWYLMYPGPVTPSPFSSLPSAPAPAAIVSPWS